MKRLKVVTGLLIIFLSPILLSGCDMSDSYVRGEVETYCGGNPKDINCGGRGKGEWVLPF